MSIDAVALLRIADLKVSDSYVEHRGDCTLLHTFQRFHGPDPDEHGLALRQIVGDALDGHDDARGILIFPDVCEPRGTTYDAIVEELGKAAVWAPKVGPDHVPDRITKAAAGSFEALMRSAIEVMGPEGRSDVELAEICFMVRAATQGREDAVRDYDEQLGKLRSAMGDAFVAELEVHLTKRYEAMLAAQEEQQARMAQMSARMGAGEPLVSQNELSSFMKSGGAEQVLAALGPGMKDDLVAELEGLDLTKLDDDDLAKQLAAALGIDVTKKKS